MSKSAVQAVLWMVLLLISIPCLAQRTTATLAGIVTDSTGGVVPGASIELTSENTHAVLTQVTSATGEFVFASVPADKYVIKIVMAGFKTMEVKEIILGAAQNVRRTFLLEVGGVQDSVSVTDEAPLVNALTPEQRTEYETLVVGSLPMSNRNISKILEITPGLTRDSSDAGNYGGRVRLNGLGGSSVRITANGTDASGNSGTPGLSQWQQFNKIDVMSVEAVGEVQVVKGVFSAEYGPALAGNVNFITKSGNDNWHGSAFYRYEGAALDARNPFLKSKPNLVWNQYGGSLGGPIKRDKVFFFVAYEGYSQRAPSLLSGNVPTESFRQAILKALPFTETQLLLDTLPLPNQPVNANALLGVWQGSRGTQANDDHIDSRMDVMLWGGNLSGVYTKGHPSLFQPRVADGNPRRFDSRSDRLGINYVRGRGYWTAESRYGFNENQLFRSDAFTTLLDPARPETIPYQRRVPTLGFPGMVSTSAEQLNRGSEPSHSLEQQFAHVAGKHTLKFGGLFIRQGGTRLNGVSPRINYQNLADIQANRPNRIEQQYTANPYVWHAAQFGFFLQDDWRTTSKVVLNLGIRYDWFGKTVAKPVDPAHPSGYFNRDGLLNAATFQFGPVRNPDDPFNNDSVNFFPRFGFAYDFKGTGKTVMRGGFGIMFQAIDPYTIEQSVSNPNTPFNYVFSPNEIATYSIRWPNLYNEDLLPIVQVPNDRQSNPVLDPNIRAPYAMNFSLGVQRSLSSKLVLETSFVGSRGVKFLMVRTYNEPNRLTGIRPNPLLGQSLYMDNSQQTSYYAWQTSLNQRLTHKLSFNVNYTFGKALSYTGGDISKGSTGDTTYNVQDYFNVRAEHGPSTGDITHLFVGNWVYQIPSLPFAKGHLATQVLGGWEVSGFFKTNTGAPVDITQTSAAAFSRPDLVDFNGAVNAQCCGFGHVQYLNPAAFSKVPITAVSGQTIRNGNAGHNALRGPGFVGADLSLAKNVPLHLPGEGANLQLRADMTNIFNHPNYDGVVTSIDSVNFGQVTSTKSVRTIQLQMRLSF